MAGSQDGSLMTVAQAKARLHEIGHGSGDAMPWLANPLVRAGMLVAVGAIAGRAIFGRRGTKGGQSAGLHGQMSRVVMQALLAAAPMLIQHFVRASPRAGESPAG